MTFADGPSDDLQACDLGTVGYRDGLAIQASLRERRQAGELSDTLLLLEHPPVYTRGRRSSDNELALGEQFYRARGIDVLDTDRGGRVTYHGPGQLVGYPIMALEDVGAFLRMMEAAIIEALGAEGVQARSRHDEGIDYTGVWVRERKIASIGLHVARGVSTHGFAINVDNDLAPFSWVVACGLPEVAMTSLARELGAAAPGEGRYERTPLFARFRARMADSFCRAHGRRARWVSEAELRSGSANARGAAPAGAEPIKMTSGSRAEAVPA